MSRAGVRATVAAFLAPPAVPGLSAMYRAAPTLIEGDSWAPIIEDAWGAAAYVHINEHAEHRLTLGGATGGIKQITYQMALVVMFRWVIPDGASAIDGEPDGWADAYDYLIDTLIARMRSDRTFGAGSGGVIWQAGEGPHDLRLMTDLPRIDDGEVIVMSALEFEAVEMVAS